MKRDLRSRLQKPQKKELSEILSQGILGRRKDVFEKQQEMQAIAARRAAEREEAERLKAMALDEYTSRREAEKVKSSYGKPTISGGAYQYFKSIGAITGHADGRGYNPFRWELTNFTIDTRVIASRGTPGNIEMYARDIAIAEANKGKKFTMRQDDIDSAVEQESELSSRSPTGLTAQYRSEPIKTQQSQAEVRPAVIKEKEQAAKIAQEKHNAEWERAFGFEKKVEQLKTEKQERYKKLKFAAEAAPTAYYSAGFIKPTIESKVSGMSTEGQKKLYETSAERATEISDEVRNIYGEQSQKSRAVAGLSEKINEKVRLFNNQVERAEAQGMTAAKAKQLNRTKDKLDKEIKELNSLIENVELKGEKKELVREYQDLTDKITAATPGYEESNIFIGSSIFPKTFTEVSREETDFFGGVGRGVADIFSEGFKKNLGTPNFFTENLSAKFKETITPGFELVGKGVGANFAPISYGVGQPVSVLAGASTEAIDKSTRKLLGMPKMKRSDYVDFNKLLGVPEKEKIQTYTSDSFEGVQDLPTMKQDKKYFKDNIKEVELIRNWKSPNFENITYASAFVGGLAGESVAFSGVGKGIAKLGTKSVQSIEAGKALFYGKTGQTSGAFSRVTIFPKGLKIKTLLGEEEVSSGALEGIFTKVGKKPAGELLETMRPRVFNSLGVAVVDKGKKAQQFYSLTAVQQTPLFATESAFVIPKNSVLQVGLKKGGATLLRKSFKPTSAEGLVVLGEDTSVNVSKEAVSFVGSQSIEKIIGGIKKGGKTAIKPKRISGEFVNLTESIDAGQKLATAQKTFATGKIAQSFGKPINFDIGVESFGLTKRIKTTSKAKGIKLSDFGVEIYSPGGKRVGLKKGGTTINLDKLRETKNFFTRKAINKKKNTIDLTKFDDVAPDYINALNKKSVVISKTKNKSATSNEQFNRLLGSLSVVEPATKLAISKQSTRLGLQLGTAKAGTSLFRKGRTSSVVRLKPGTTYKPISQTKKAVVPRLSSPTFGGTKIFTTTIPRLSENIFNSTTPKLTTGTATTTSTITTTIPRITTTTTPTTRPVFTPVPITPPPRTKFEWLPGLDDEPKKKKDDFLKFFKGFDVFVKKKGKFKKATKKSLPFAEALSLGQKITDISAARSFKLGEGSLISGSPNSFFSKKDTSYKFRPSRSKKFPGVFVEKSKFAMDVRGEVPRPRNPGRKKKKKINNEIFKRSVF